MPSLGGEHLSARSKLVSHQLWCSQKPSQRELQMSTRVISSKEQELVCRDTGERLVQVSGLAAILPLQEGHPLPSYHHSLLLPSLCCWSLRHLTQTPVSAWSLYNLLSRACLNFKKFCIMSPYISYSAAQTETLSALSLSQTSINITSSLILRN